MNLHQISLSRAEARAQRIQDGLRGPNGGFTEALVRPNAQQDDAFPFEYLLHGRETHWTQMRRDTAESWETAPLSDL